MNAQKTAVLPRLHRTEPTNSPTRGHAAGFTMPQMKQVVEALEEAGLRNRLKVIVGGAPVNLKFADDIGADGYAQDGGEVITLVRSLLSA